VRSALQVLVYRSSAWQQCSVLLQCSMRLCSRRAARRAAAGQAGLVLQLVLQNGALQAEMRCTKSTKRPRSEVGAGRCLTCLTLGEPATGRKSAPLRAGPPPWPPALPTRPLTHPPKDGLRLRLRTARRAHQGPGGAAGGAGQGSAAQHPRGGSCRWGCPPAPAAASSLRGPCTGLPAQRHVQRCWLPLRCASALLRVPHAKPDKVVCTRAARLC
jgi:hypothetical protein